jgi:predicted O-linked N-acetylglucosamine transferase (SPINDLY family)
MCSDNAKAFELSKQFGKQFEIDLSGLSHPNDARLDKRLRIGYVSGDFRQHSVAYFIRPILANHDKQKTEIFCYYNHYHVDQVTKQLMGHATHWRSIFGVSDEDTVKLIRQDAIDILVDLSGHTGHNRLLLFAHKPAPVQVTWIGYPATTGLSAMDYRLTSIHRDPLGWNERYHTETLVRLSTSTCFQPEVALPEINALPALKNGYLTFASFHVPNKITATTLSLWAKILSALPTAKLILAPDTAKDQIIRQFQLLGIAADRLNFFCHQPLPQYLALHNQIDIMLDTFPYNGSTVSRHSLWMGVPVLTLAGRQAVSRVGLALMTQLGLETFAAENEQDLFENARRWANDLDGLAQVRNTLREKMQNAPFSKPALIVDDLEAVYREMWRKWCEQQKQSHDE